MKYSVGDKLIFNDDGSFGSSSYVGIIIRIDDNDNPYKYHMSWDNDTDISVESESTLGEMYLLTSNLPEGLFTL